MKNSLKVTSLFLSSFLFSTASVSGDYIRAEKSLSSGKDRYEVEARFNVHPSNDILMSHQVIKDVEGMEYSLNLAYLRHTHMFTPRLFGQVDLGVAHETFGDTYLIINEATGASTDFDSDGMSLWTTLALNYVVTPQVIAGIDFTTSEDILNETLTGTHRVRGTLAWMPTENIAITWRGGFAKIRGDFAHATSTEHLVADDYQVSHEFFAGYTTKHNLTPYFMVRDMNNSGDRIVAMGFRYDFK